MFRLCKCKNNISINFHTDVPILFDRLLFGNKACFIAYLSEDYFIC